MGWEAIIAIIAQYGLPLAESLWKKWNTGAAPTQADWDELNAIADKTAADYLAAAQARLGAAKPPSS
jgi:hypothetical protein